MSDQAAHFVGSIPEYYDRHLGPRIFAGFAEDLARRVAFLAPSEVLELAAGTGIVTRALRDALPDASKLVATDLNPPMLEVARSKFHGGEAVHFQPADASSLPFADASFDTLVCQFGVMFFPDKAASYGEVLRVLKPGGRYLFNVWDAWENNPFARIAHDVVAGFFPDDPPGFYRVPFGYCDKDLIAGSLDDAGFSDIDIETVEVTSAIPSAEDFASGLVYGNPLLEEIVERGGDDQAVHGAISVAIEEHLGENMPLQAIVVSTGKPS